MATGTCQQEEGVEALQGGSVHQALAQAPHGSGHGTEPVGVWEAFGQCSDTWFGFWVVL